MLAAAGAAALVLSLIASPALGHGDGDRGRHGHRGDGRRGAEVSSRDVTFLKEAAQGDLFEIVGGQMAQARAVSNEAKALGTRLASDHTMALQALTILAGTLDVTLPSQMSDEQTSELADLGSASGLDFDHAYAKMEVEDHHHDISDFRTEVRKGSSTQVRAFAAVSLPMLGLHLVLSEQTSEAVDRMTGQQGWSSGSGSSQ
jgi:putative membrane protein